MSESTATAAPEIPAELKTQIETIQAFATAHNALSTGQFSLNQFKSVADSMVFLAKAHKSAVEAAIAHPEAALVPELSPYLEKKVEGGEAKDGSA